MKQLTNDQRETLRDMLSEWSLEAGEPDEFADLRERARSEDPLDVTSEECGRILKTFGANNLGVWRRGVALMNSIEEGARR